MPIFLNNAEQEQCITARDAVEALENGIRQFARGDAIRRPRIDNLLPTSRPEEFFCFSSMEGGIRDPGYYALRIKPDIYSWPVVNGKRREATYCVKPGLFGGMVFLYAVDNAEFLAFMNDGFIQHMRVAASAALGMKYLSRPDSHVLGILGSGGMAHFIPLTASVVRPIERLLVYSPTRANLDRYCREMAEKLECEIVPADSAEQVVRGSDIVCACTTSMEPVMAPDWIQPGTHLNNVTHWELGPAVCSTVNSVGIYVRRRPVHIDGYFDDDFGIRLNVMSYTGGQPEERERVPVGVPNRNRYSNAKIVDCVNWETGEPYAQRRSRDEITVLANASYGTLEGDVGNSAGIQGIQFSSIGGKIYERARERGLGQHFPLEMFLQDIPT